MQRRNITDLIKNAVGTVFLLAGAFFVCSTLVSMRAVFADPIAPEITTTAATTTTASPRTANARNTAASRANASMANRTANNTTSRTTNTSRGVAARTTTSRGTATNTAASRAQSSAASRSVGTRGVATRTGAATNTATQSRGVAARTSTTARVSANNTTTRGVAARSGTNGSRVSLQGAAIRGSSSSTTYTYLQNKLYTGNYSNILDSNTGLISSEAFNNCMESYYTCMDEICTARNQAQRRCACAGRVKAFADAESKLETANEELIKVSGELALLVATKGKDVSAALQLTDAEKVMNCVSWQETASEFGESSTQAKEWCTSHGIFKDGGGTVDSCEKPKYCSSKGQGANDFGFDVSEINGSGSDILAKLQSWASAKENTISILNTSNTDVSNAFEKLNTVVSNLVGTNGALSNDASGDTLSNKWGYDLFQYAHNNVCNRVLDSCFNGIYEACGTPPNNTFVGGTRKCGNGQSQCPFNYSSYVNVKDSGNGGDLDFITSSSTSSSVSNSATCFGYTSTSGDPYSNLRGTVADARRSIMQKYALDANADCDVYGEQLRTQAQNIGYQKVAAQQALQQKRLEFAQEEESANATALANAKQNYLECLDEIYQCRIDTEQMYKWPGTRIKSYCNTMSNVPHCYEQMICNQNATRVITEEDVNNSKNETLEKNVVTLADILSADAVTDGRATCLNNDTLVDEIRRYRGPQTSGGSQTSGDSQTSGGSQTSESNDQNQ